MDQNLYLNKYIFILATVIILFGVINTALNSYNSNYNILKIIIKDTESYRIFYILNGILAIYILLHIIINKKNKSKLINEQIINFKINCPNAEKVIWWITDVNKSIIYSPELAYNEYKNSGISNVQLDGNAYLKFPCLNQSNLKTSITNKQLHYREIHGGMLSEVKTFFIDC